MGKRGGSKRHWIEVRVREEIGPNKYEKKSLFFYEACGADASKRYKGPGHIMSAETVKKEKQIGTGIGDFFTLGDRLIREFRRSENRSRLEIPEVQDISPSRSQSKFGRRLKGAR